MHRRCCSERSADEGRRGMEQATRHGREPVSRPRQHYAAFGAWESQLTDVPISPGRKANLHRPVDADQDHGAHGMFDDRAGGLLDPSFLRSLPEIIRTFVAALRRTAQSKVRRYGRTVTLKAAKVR